MKISPYKFKAPFIRTDKIRADADETRMRHCNPLEFPIEVEFLCQDLHIYVDPMPGLLDETGADALLLGDCKTIIVDQGEYSNVFMHNRLRFSMAHELGHFVLHRSIFSGINHKSKEEWKKFHHEIDEVEWRKIEFHANEFAGRLLMPPEELRQHLNALALKAQKKGFTNFSISAHEAKEYMATPLSRIFGVSCQCVIIRIDREGLWPPQIKTIP